MEKFLFIFVLSLCCMQIQSNPGDPKSGPGEDSAGRKDSVSADTFDFFDSDQVLEMSLFFDLKEFFKSRKRPEYMKAAITVSKSENTTGIEDTIKIKARGNMRRLYCQFPPVMLKFKNDSLGIPYSGKLKLVIPCMNSDKYEGYVLREYLAYKLFNLVSDYSLRTRLIRVTINDSKTNSKSYAFYGFLIENENSLAQRNNAVMITNANLGQSNMQEDLMVRVALFNYMIGNTDWSVPMQHNIRILKSNAVLSEKGIPVVYDFDYAGLVSPPYAAPAEELPIKDVKERYYLGLCLHNEELDKAVEEFEGLKEEFLGTVSDFNYLSEYERKITETYIQSFYRMMKNKNSLIGMLSRSCKL